MSEHDQWRATRLGWAADHVNIKVSVSDLVNHEEVFHYSIPAVQEFGTGQVEQANTVDSDKLLVDRELLLISKLNPRKSTICLARPDPDLLTVCSTEFIPVAESSANLHFLTYLCASSDFRQNLEARVNSATKSHQRVNPGDILHAEIELPSIIRQGAIADFLDRETARIDAMIAKQEELVSLLGERRSAVIAHAVTKGLNPDAPMKDSGVEWLGEVPTHWIVAALKYHGSTQAGSGFPHEHQGVEDAPIPFYKVNALGRANRDGVIRDRYDSVEPETAAELGARVIPRESLVLAKIGAALLLGRIRILAYDSCIDNNMLAFMPEAETSSRFAMYAFQQLDFTKLVNPGAVPSLSEREFRAYELAWPPVAEQQEIADHLDTVTARMDGVIAKAQESVQLMRERRAALISDAVTGRLDIDTYGRKREVVGA